MYGDVCMVVYGGVCESECVKVSVCVTAKKKGERYPGLCNAICVCLGDCTGCVCVCCVKTD